MKISEASIKLMFDELLDELYPEVEISDIRFSASQILRNCDPIAYRIELSDFEDMNQEYNDNE